MATITSVLLIAVLCVSVYFASCEEDYANCDQDLDVLAKALYTPENKKELIRNFYPPRSSASRFIKVTYKFNGTDCNVTYIWAIGGFLLMQPPKIFQFTSLFFSTLANNLIDMVLELPRECFELVKGNDTNCTCENDGNVLDILTQQV